MRKSSVEFTVASRGHIQDFDSFKSIHRDLLEVCQTHAYMFLAQLSFRALLSSIHSVPVGHDYRVV